MDEEQREQHRVMLHHMSDAAAWLHSSVADAIESSTPGSICLSVLDMSSAPKCSHAMISAVYIIGCLAQALEIPPEVMRSAGVTVAADMLIWPARDGSR